MAKRARQAPKYLSWETAPPTLSPKQAAMLLPYTQDMVTRKCQRGELPAQKVGGRWIMDRNKLREFCTGSGTGTTAEDEINSLKQRLSAAERQIASLTALMMR